MREKGFTVIELIMVIVIVAILSVGTALFLGNIAGQRISAAAEKIIADLRYAQGLAAASRNNCGVTFSTANNNYTVFENNNPADPAIYPLTQGDFTVDFDNLTEYDGVSITSISIGTGSLVSFDSFGIPYDSTGAALASDAEIELNNSVTIVIHPETGTVEIQ